MPNPVNPAVLDRDRQDLADALSEVKANEKGLDYADSVAVIEAYITLIERAKETARLLAEAQGKLDRVVSCR